MTESLEGIRILLSGSVPHDAAPEDKQRILDFVRTLAASVFGRRGHIVHGGAPSLCDTLVDAAREHRKDHADRAGLTLVVSQFFADQYRDKLAEWKKVVGADGVIETRLALSDPKTGEISRQESLKIMRLILVEQTNVLVAIGGKWWEKAPAFAGVPTEIELARDNHLPLFLLGGLGGATRDYVKAHPHVLQGCANGLKDTENLQLSEIADAKQLVQRVIEQIGLLPLRARAAKSGRPFRILCLDGGGIRGAFTAAVLKHWETATHCRAADHFDLIAGTSTGGILAIGLGFGMPASQMLDFYQTEGPEIFPLETATRQLWHSFRHWFGAKFDQTVLATKLEAAYAKTPVKCSVLDDALTRLAIPIYDSESDNPIVLRTPHGRGGDNDRGWPAVGTALATAAAPTYFNPVKLGNMLAVDGGVWANSPTTIALAEAVSEMDVAPERIEMLSIGTTFTPKLLGKPDELDGTMIEPILRPAIGWLPAKVLSLFLKPVRFEGKLGRIANIAGFLMKAQGQTADYVAARLLGDERFLRVDVPAESAILDDAAAINRLIGSGNVIAEKTLNRVRTQFFNRIPVDPWK